MEAKSQKNTVPVPKLHALKAYGGSGDKVTSFSTSALGGGEKFTSRSCRFYPEDSRM